jgi:aspartate racemase
VRCLGLIGGLGVGATIYYYQELVKAHLEQGQVANLVMLHADVNRVLQYAAAGETSGMAEYLLQLIRRLSAAGAEIIAIPATTPHLCAPELMKRSPIPLVSLVDEIIREVNDKGLKLVFNRANTDFPHIDGARLHLKAIMEQLTGNPPH